MYVFPDLLLFPLLKITMAPRKESNDGGSTRKRKQPEKDTEEYYRKRERNNVAVKKSRDKAKSKAKETDQLVMRLRQENVDLDRKVQTLTKELDLLRDLVLANASGYSKPDPNPEPIVEIKEEVGCGTEMEDFLAIALRDHEYCS